MSKVSLQEIVSVTSQARRSQLAENVLANNRLMNILKAQGYFDRPKLTRLQMFWRGFKVPFQRMRDAWLVLTGKAEICQGCDY